MGETLDELLVLEEVNEYFNFKEKVEEQKEFLEDYSDYLKVDIENNGYNYIKTETNGKLTTVHFLDEDEEVFVTGVARRSPEDEYNKIIGEVLAMSRVYSEIMTQ